MFGHATVLLKMFAMGEFQQKVWPATFLAVLQSARIEK